MPSGCHMGWVVSESVRWDGTVIGPGGTRSATAPPWLSMHSLGLKHGNLLYKSKLFFMYQEFLK